MPLTGRIQLLVILLGLLALALPWLAWARLAALERRSGRRLLVRGVTGEHCYRLDAPVAAIAAEAGASVEAVKKRLQRARAMIAACMESKGASA